MTKTARNNEIIELRYEKLLTNTEIGSIFGITKERVRQIVGSAKKYYAIKKDVWTKNALSDNGATNSELSQKTGLPVYFIIKTRSSVRHAIEGGAIKIGTISEEIVSKKLANNGIVNKLMPHRHPFDILLSNGKRVDVKSATGFIRGRKHYGFDLKRRKRGDYADFFIFYIIPIDTLFIVPAGEVIGDTVRIFHPHKRLSKYAIFKDNYGVLKD